MSKSLNGVLKQMEELAKELQCREQQQLESSEGQTESKVMLSCKELSCYLGVDEKTVRNHHLHDQIPNMMIGNRRLFRKDAVDWYTHLCTVERIGDSVLQEEYRRTFLRGDGPGPYNNGKNIH